MEEIDLPCPQTIQVAIVDDHQVLVDAIQIAIQSQKDLHVAGTAADCAGCHALLLRLAQAGAPPQVLLLDVGLPDGDGIELVAALKEICPATHILILTSLSDEVTLLRAIHAGVSGFVAKSRGLSEVLAGIRKAACGEIAVPAGLLIGLLNRAQSPAAPAPTPSKEMPTQRELEILSLLSKGRSVDEIAAQLFITGQTVRTHIRNLLHRLGAHTRLQAVSSAISRGWIHPPA
jgi:two-component system, NarL family, nitrate/nitrite response regulator NarL